MPLKNDLDLETRIKEMNMDLRDNPDLYYHFLKQAPLIVGPWVARDTQNSGTLESYYRRAYYSIICNQVIACVARYDWNIIKPAYEEERHVWSWWLYSNLPLPLRGGADTLEKAQRDVDDLLRSENLILLGSINDGPLQTPLNRWELIKEKL